MMSLKIRAQHKKWGQRCQPEPRRGPEILSYAGGMKHAKKEIGIERLNGYG